MGYSCGIQWDYNKVKDFIEGQEGNNCTLITLENEYKNTKQKINIKCRCGENFRTSFQKFIHRKKRQCNKCGLVDYSKKQAKSHEIFIREVFLKYDKEYEILSTYINSKTKVAVKHIKCDRIFFKYPNDLLNQGCPYCSLEKRTKIRAKSHEKFIQQIKELYGDEYIVLGIYKNNKTKILVKHNMSDCNYEWEVNPKVLLRNNICPKCSKTIKITPFIAKRRIYELYGDEYTLISEEIIGAKEKVLIRHNICNNMWNVNLSNFLRNKSGCPECSKPRGEKVICDYLEDHNIPFERQYSFADCRDKYVLRFDFAIFENINKEKLKLLLEFDGYQHMKPVKYFGGIDAFEDLKRKDQIKNAYCEKYNIRLLRIPYWDFYNLEEILSNELNNLKEAI